MKPTSDPTFTKPETLRGRVEDHLRNAIMEGRLTGGDRLREQEICNRLNISRPTLREALRTLEAERLVVLEPHRSPTVVQMTEKSASDLYALRQLLEGHAAFQFALVANDAMIERLRQSVRGLHDSASSGDIARLLASKQSFYEVLLAGADNQLVKETLLGLLSRINLLRATSFSRPARLGVSLAEIDLILRKIEARDPEGAREAAHAHIANAKVAALEVLKRQASTDIAAL